MLKLMQSFRSWAENCGNGTLASSSGHSGSLFAKRVTCGLNVNGGGCDVDWDIFASINVFTGWGNIAPKGGTAPGMQPVILRTSSSLAIRSFELAMPRNEAIFLLSHDKWAGRIIKVYWSVCLWHTSIAFAPLCNGTCRWFDASTLVRTGGCRMSKMGTGGFFTDIIRRMIVWNVPKSSSEASFALVAAGAWAICKRRTCELILLTRDELGSILTLPLIFIIFSYYEKEHIVRAPAREGESERAKLNISNWSKENRLEYIIMNEFEKNCNENERERDTTHVFDSKTYHLPCAKNKHNKNNIKDSIDYYCFLSFSREKKSFAWVFVLFSFHKKYLPNIRWVWEIDT